MAAIDTSNKLDIVQGVALVPWEWNNLGAVFGSGRQNTQAVAARASFVLRKGSDALQQPAAAADGGAAAQFGGVLEGLGDVGFNLRAKQYAFHISASNLTYKQGVLSASTRQQQWGCVFADLQCNGRAGIISG